MAGKDNLTPFTSTYQPKNNGRKPNHLKKYLKDNGIGTTDVRKILGGILTNIKTIDELKEKIKDEDTPVIVKIPLMIMMQEIGKGKMSAFEFLIRYGYGEPKQEIESSINTSVLVESMTHEEKENLIKEFLKGNDSKDS